ncbi:HXXXD-type acyl-transferase family protein [Euphorbia peplus]|nr:HXXXD-type acyl-transferase family protein [Euphorbia peplus]
MSMANGVRIPKPQMEAMQTIPPYKITYPRQVLKVSSQEDPFGSSIFKASLNIILFFDKQSDDHKDDSGWHVAGFIKESLGRALRDEPLLSGRLRRGEDGHGDLEIVANDSGIRLFEAKTDVTLKDFLGLEDVKMAQSQLVYWKDIDEKNPQFSPLFYVQVTNFKCGGYSIGISCSLLLADVLIMDKFLQKWTKIHRDIVLKNKEPKVPIFYVPNLKAPSSNLNGLYPSTTRPSICQTVIYKVSSISELIDFKEHLALFCLEEAEKKFEITKNSLEFAFLVKESPETIEARELKKCEIGKSQNDQVIILKTSDLNEYIGLKEVYFREGSKPATTSYWIGSSDGRVHVIAIPSYDKLGDAGDLNIIVTIPYENEINN